MSELLQNINVLYLLLVLAGLVGGMLVGRQSRHKEITNAASQLNETLEKEIDALRRRVSDLEQDKIRQNNILDAIRYALRQHHLRIVINGEFVSLIDNTGQSKITRIRPRKQATAQDADDDDAAN